MRYRRNKNTRSQDAVMRFSFASNAVLLIVREFEEDGDEHLGAELAEMDMPVDEARELAKTINAFADLAEQRAVQVKAGGR